MAEEFEVRGEAREGGHYRVPAAAVETFRRDGYVHLPGLLSAAEVDELERVYERFLRREIDVPGRDFCDMSGAYGGDPEDYELINVMLPRRHWPAWRGNALERRAAEVAEALCGPGMALDYDQLLAKRPHASSAEFAWHQDLAYWPATEDTRTATIWLALDDATVENGCMRFVPGSHLEPELRPHRPLHGDRDTSHTLVADVDEALDTVRAAPIRRGDCTVHGERVLHGSGGNHTSGWRRAYVVAFRSIETIAEERRLGFTHSHEDGSDTLDSVLEGR